MDMTIGEIITIIVALSMSRIFDLIILIVGFFTGKFVKLPIINMKGYSRNKSDNIQSHNRTLNFSPSLFSYHRYPAPEEKNKQPDENKPEQNKQPDENKD